jgi:hypothetical protein
LVEDVDYSNAPAKRSNRFVRIRAVRNSSGINLLPERIARYKTTTRNTEVDGYTTVTAADWAGIVDEWLPAAGAPANTVFYIATHGPSEVLTDIAAVDTINEGDFLVALTAATSQATTAGRVDLAATTGSTTAVSINQLLNKLGRALSAKTSANTNSSILVDLRCD